MSIKQKTWSIKAQDTVTCDHEYNHFFGMGYAMIDGFHTRLKGYMKKNELIGPVFAQIDSRPRSISGITRSDDVNFGKWIQALRYEIDEGRPGLKLKNQVEVPWYIIDDMKNYGMHRHFTDGCSILMFGRGAIKAWTCYW